MQMGDVRSADLILDVLPISFGCLTSALAYVNVNVHDLD
jgi:hypothetical protein